MLSVRLQEYELADLFDALGVWRCLDAGTIAVRLESSQPAALCTLPGAVSYYMRLLDGEREWARVHYVDCPVAGIVGRWPSSLKIGGVTLYRRGHQQRPAPISPPPAHAS